MESNRICFHCVELGSKLETLSDVIVTAVVIGDEANSKLRAIVVVWDI